MHSCLDIMLGFIKGLAGLSLDIQNCLGALNHFIPYCINMPNVISAAKDEGWTNLSYCRWHSRHFLLFEIHSGLVLLHFETSPSSIAFLITETISGGAKKTQQINETSTDKKSNNKLSFKKLPDSTDKYWSNRKHSVAQLIINELVLHVVKP